MRVVPKPSKPEGADSSWWEAWRRAREFAAQAFRVEGAHLLSHFKSPRNEQLMRRILADRSLQVHEDGGEWGYAYLLRKAAYAALTAWGVAAEEPTVVARSTGTKQAATARTRQPQRRR